MQDYHYKTTLEQAEQLLRLAEEEFYRPEEDVVLESIGKQIHQAIAHYLTSFLLRHAREVRPSMPISYLIKLCKEVDPKFDKLNMNPEWMDDKFLFTLTEISKALDIARQTKELTQILPN